MYVKTLDYIRQNRMFASGDRVIVGLSGGADSVCLLVILDELKKELNIELKAVHVHHGLRGKEADRDLGYAEKLSESLGVPFVCVHVDAAAYGKEHGLSEEEAGRILRYEIFEKERISWEGTKIAVAHHADDQAETILYHLFRGTGLRGLGGIRPVRGRIVRPLLSSGRDEIVAYLEEKGISYCEDSTNALMDYKRNRLRNLIIPTIKEQINEQAASNILHAGALAAQADAYLEKQALKIMSVYGKRTEGGIGISAEPLTHEDEIIKTYVIRQMIAEAAGTEKDITSVHVEMTVRLLDLAVGSRISLPYALEAVRNYEELWIKKKKTEDHVDKDKADLLPSLQITSFPYKKGQEIPKNRYTKWFDYDKIKGALSVRYRETGDYITLADGGRKTVKAFMIDEKIPKEERGEIPLVAEDSHILWIIGFRISEYYKITEDTHTVLQIQLDGGTTDGR